MADVQEAIRKLRKALGGIGQERLARRTGVTVRTVARWESPGAKVCAAVLAQLRTMALNIGANDVALIFEERLRTDFDLLVDEDMPRTPEERSLVAEFLKRHRADEKQVIGQARSGRPTLRQNELKM